MTTQPDDFIVVNDPINVFRPKECYDNELIIDWLKDDELTLNMVLLGHGKYWRVCDSSVGLVLKRCDQNGTILRGANAEMWPCENVDFTKMRGRVLLAMLHFEDMGKNASMREIATHVGSSVRGVEKQIKELCRMGLASKEQRTHRSSCLTETGRELAQRSVQ